MSRRRNLGASATSAFASLSLRRFCSSVCPSSSSSFSPRNQQALNSIFHSTHHPPVWPCIGTKRSSALPASSHATAPSSQDSLACAPVWSIPSWPYPSFGFPLHPSLSHRRGHTHSRAFRKTSGPGIFNSDFNIDLILLGYSGWRCGL